MGHGFTDFASLEVEADNISICREAGQLHRQAIVLPTLRHPVAADTIATGNSLGIVLRSRVMLVIYGLATDPSTERLFLAGAMRRIIRAFRLIGLSIRTDGGGATTVLSPRRYALRERLEGPQRAMHFQTVGLAVIRALYGSVATTPKTAVVGQCSGSSWRSSSTRWNSHRYGKCCPTAWDTKAKTRSAR